MVLSWGQPKMMLLLLIISTVLVFGETQNSREFKKIGQPEYTLTGSHVVMYVAIAELTYVCK